jgi:hypothetical protein
MVKEPVFILLVVGDLFCYYDLAVQAEVPLAARERLN